MFSQPLSYESFAPTASRPNTLRCLPHIAGFFLVLLVGCHQSSMTESKSGPERLNAKLRLLVVGDPGMASAIEQLKGEWNAQTGSTVEVQQAEKIDFSAASPPAVDAMIVASADVGPLAEKKWITAIPRELIDDSERFGGTTNGDRPTTSNWGTIFSLLRSREAAWGSEAMAIPLGSPVLVCYYRADLLEKFGAKPPRTWTEYRKLAETLGDRAKLGDAAPPAGAPWAGALEPLGPGWAGIDLIARAAPYATHRANYSALFKIDTMEPLINSPPFVQALKELVETASAAPAEQFTYGPAEVRKAFWEGRCGLALTWPSAAMKIPSENKSVRVGFAELPGSNQTYNVSSKNWEKRATDETGQVPLLGIAGRMGVVAAQTPDESREAAFRLLLWLSGEQWNRQVCAASPATTLFRASDLKSPQAWVEKSASSPSAAQYAEITRKTLTRQQSLLALRIPGRAEYLAALDEAVQKAVRKQASPEEALSQATRKWQETTQRLGTEAQKSAYLRSLGL